MNPLRVALAVVAALLVALGIYNFVNAMSDSLRLGGDALNGYARDGHYFVANHGRYTEVSAEAWERSRTQAESVFVTHPLAMAGMAYLLFAVYLPAVVGRPLPETPERVKSVRGTGSQLASTSCGARLGRINIRVRVTVYSGGVVVKPMFMAPRAILARELAATRKSTRMFARGVEIEHTAADLASPILLTIDETSAVATSISEILPGGARRG